jgi:hypothetical protein
MKQVLAGVAVAALLCAVPALAQTTTSPAAGTKSTTQGSAAGTSTPQATAQNKTHKRSASHAMSSKKSHENDDAMTEKLNRQEVERLKAGG